MGARIALFIMMGLLGDPLEATTVEIGATSRNVDEIPWAYRAAADRVGVNPTLLWTMALQESGMLRGSREAPWPWTLNIAGKAARFATRERACIALHRALESTSPKRIDVGLVQVNWGYHRKGIQTPCELLDPYRNLAIACRYLLQLHRDGESWLQTAARYHHPAGGSEANHYVASLRRRLLKLARDHRLRASRADGITMLDRNP